MTKHHNQVASCRGQGLFGVCFHIIIRHWRKSGQELKQGRKLETGRCRVRGGCCWLACCPCCSACLQPSTRVWHPQWSALHPSLTNEENALEPGLLGARSEWGSLGSDDSSLYQVDIKLVSKPDVVCFILKPLSWLKNMFELLNI